MLLKKKKAQDNNNNWCVVLKSLESEMDRGRLAKKIQQAFDISQQESYDLMENTPIILLDHLTQDTAQKVLDYFNEKGVELALSNDGFFKRRCYRTVWPQIPNLTFLLKESVQSESYTKSQESNGKASPELSSASVLPKVKDLKVPSEPPVASSLPPKNSAPENNEWKVKYQDEMRKGTQLSQEIAKLRQEMTALKEEKNVLYSKLQGASNSLNKVEAENKKELERLLKNSRDKYDALQKEFDHSRRFFEEKISNLENEKTESLKGVSDIQNENEELKKKKDALDQEIFLQQEKLQKAATQKEEYEKKLDIRVESLTAQIKTQESLVRELTSKLHESENLNTERESREEESKKQIELLMSKLRDRDLKLDELQKQSLQLMQKIGQQDEAFKKRIQDAQVVESNLIEAQRHIQDLQYQMEYQTWVHEKNEILKGLEEKELRLKGLVDRQERIEQEARSKQDELKSLLVEQDSLEKNMIEDKQVLKQLMDKLNKSHIIQKPSS